MMEQKPDDRNKEKLKSYIDWVNHNMEMGSDLFLNPLAPFSSKDIGDLNARRKVGLNDVHREIEDEADVQTKGIKK